MKPKKIGEKPKVGKFKEPVTDFLRESKAFYKKADDWVIEKTTFPKKVVETKKVQTSAFDRLKIFGPTLLLGLGLTGSNLNQARINGDLPNLNRLGENITIAGENLITPVKDLIEGKTPATPLKNSEEVKLTKREQGAINQAGIGFVATLATTVGVGLFGSFKKSTTKGEGNAIPENQNPDIQNPDIQNPDIQNPDIQNPDIQNPDIQNPDIQNPDIQNLDPKVLEILPNQTEGQEPTSQIIEAEIVEGEIIPGIIEQSVEIPELPPLEKAIANKKEALANDPEGLRQFEDLCKEFFNGKAIDFSDKLKINFIEDFAPKNSQMPKTDLKENNTISDETIEKLKIASEFDDLLVKEYDIIYNRIDELNNNTKYSIEVKRELLYSYLKKVFGDKYLEEIMMLCNELQKQLESNEDIESRQKDVSANRLYELQSSDYFEVNEWLKANQNRLVYGKELDGLRIRHYIRTEYPELMPDDMETVYKAIEGKKLKCLELKAKDTKGLNKALQTISKLVGNKNEFDSGLEKNTKFWVKKIIEFLKQSKFPISEEYYTFEIEKINHYIESDLDDLSPTRKEDLLFFILETLKNEVREIEKQRQEEHRKKVVEDESNINILDVKIKELELQLENAELENAQLEKQAREEAELAEKNEDRGAIRVEIIRLLEAREEYTEDNVNSVYESLFKNSSINRELRQLWIGQAMSVIKDETKFSEDISDLEIRESERYKKLIKRIIGSLETYRNYGSFDININDMLRLPRSSIKRVFEVNISLVGELIDSPRINTSQRIKELLKVEAEKNFNDWKAKDFSKQNDLKEKAKYEIEEDKLLQPEGRNTIKQTIVRLLGVRGEYTDDDIIFIHKNLFKFIADDRSLRRSLIAGVMKEITNELKFPENSTEKEIKESQVYKNLIAQAIDNLHIFNPDYRDLEIPTSFIRENIDNLFPNTPERIRDFLVEDVIIIFTENR